VGLQRRPNKPGCATTVPHAPRGRSWLKLAPIGAPTSLAPGATAQITSGGQFCDREVATTFPSAPIAFRDHDRLGLTAERGGWLDGAATTTHHAPSEAGI